MKTLFSFAIALLLILSLLTQTGFTAPVQASQDEKLQATPFGTKTDLQAFKDANVDSSSKKLQSGIISDTDKLKLAKAALPFIQNIGQVDSQVKYYAQTFAGT